MLDVGARNERRLCAVTYNKSSEFEVLQGLLDRVMQLLEVPFGSDDVSYRLKPADGELMFRSSSLTINFPTGKIGQSGKITKSFPIEKIF